MRNKLWGRALAFTLIFSFLSVPLSLSAREGGSLTLSETVRQVLAVHPLTQAAQARVAVALGMVRQARAYANPAFKFAHNDFTRERTYGLTQFLEWPFKRTYRIGAAKAEEQIAESEQEGVRQDLIAAAREAFFSVLLTQEQSRVAQVYEEGKVFNLVIRFDEHARKDIETVRNTLIAVPGGARVPLRALADVEVERRPNIINRENASRRLVVQCNISGRDVGGVARETERRLREQVSLPPGYHLEVGGEYEAQLSARRELLLLGTIALVGIFLLLYADFHSLRPSLLVLISLPLAFIGAVGGGGPLRRASLPGLPGRLSHALGHYRPQRHHACFPLPSLRRGGRNIVWS